MSNCWMGVVELLHQWLFSTCKSLDALLGEGKVYHIVEEFNLNIDSGIPLFLEMNVDHALEDLVEDLNARSLLENLNIC